MQELPDRVRASEREVERNSEMSEYDGLDEATLQAQVRLNKVASSFNMYLSVSIKCTNCYDCCTCCVFCGVAIEFAPLSKPIAL